MISWDQHSQKIRFSLIRLSLSLKIYLVFKWLSYCMTQKLTENWIKWLTISLDSSFLRSALDLKWLALRKINWALKGVCHENFDLKFFSCFEPIWAPDKQAQVFLNSVLTKAEIFEFLKSSAVCIKARSKVIKSLKKTPRCASHCRVNNLPNVSFDPKFYKCFFSVMPEDLSWKIIL